MSERWTDKKRGYGGGVSSNAKRLSAIAGRLEDLGGLSSKTLHRDTPEGKVTVKRFGIFERQIFEPTPPVVSSRDNRGRIVLWSYAGTTLSLQLRSCNETRSGLLEQATLTITAERIIWCGWDNTEQCFVVIYHGSYAERKFYRILVLPDAEPEPLFEVIDPYPETYAPVRAQGFYAPDGTYRVSILWGEWPTGANTGNGYLMCNSVEGDTVGSTVFAINIDTSIWCASPREASYYSGAIEWTDAGSPAWIGGRAGVFPSQLAYSSRAYFDYSNHSTIQLTPSQTDQGIIPYLYTMIGDKLLWILSEAWSPLDAGGSYTRLRAFLSNPLDPMSGTLLGTDTVAGGTTGSGLWDNAGTFAGGVYLEETGVVFCPGWENTNRVYNATLTEILYSIALPSGAWSGSAVTVVK